MGMRVSKKRNLASQISFLKPQDGSTEGLCKALECWVHMLLQHNHGLS